MKRMLFVIWSLRAGGAERSLVNLLAMLADESGSQCYDIDLLLFERQGEFLAQLPRSVHVLDCPARVSALCGPLMESIRSAPCLARRAVFKVAHGREAKSLYHKDQLLWQHVWKKSLGILDRNYDVAVAYMHGIPSYYVIDKVNAAKKILWVHHDYSKLCADKTLDAAYFGKADAVVTVSERCRGMLAHAYPALDKKFSVLQNLNSPAVIRSLSEQHIPEEYVKAMDANAPVLVSVGRLDPVKGFDIAVRSGRTLKERGVDFHWFILGSGEQRKPLEAMIRSLGLERSFTLLGARPNPYPYIRFADVVVQTSRNEGKSIVLDEAKILCKPIVSTNYNTAADQITDGVTGVLTDISPEGVAMGIQRLLCVTGLREQLVANLEKETDAQDNEFTKYMGCFA